MPRKTRAQRFETFVRDNPITARDIGADWALDRLRDLEQRLREAHHCEHAGTPGECERAWPVTIRREDIDAQ